MFETEGDLERSVMFSLNQIITSLTKCCHRIQSTATPSGNKAMKFSAEVLEVHAAAKVKSPAAADIDNCLH